MSYANQILHTDVYPFEIVRVVSEKTMWIRAMNAVLSPEWRPEIIPGGFAGHCVNQRDQKWVYSSDLRQPERRIRKHKDGRWYDSGGSRYSIEEQPRKFYDYNF